MVCDLSYKLRCVHTWIGQHLWPLIATIFFKNDVLFKVTGSHVHCKLVVSKKWCKQISGLEPFKTFCWVGRSDRDKLDRRRWTSAFITVMYTARFRRADSSATADGCCSTVDSQSESNHWLRCSGTAASHSAWRRASLGRHVTRQSALRPARRQVNGTNRSLRQRFLPLTAVYNCSRTWCWH